MGSFVRRNSLIAFFVISFLLMWSLASLAVFRILNVSDLPILYILAAWTPTIAAVVVTGLLYGLSGIKTLLGGWLKYKIGLWWYLATLLPIIIVLVIGGLYTLFRGHASYSQSDFAFLTFIELVIFNLILGPSGEEAGWRGFALPRLQGRFTALTSTIILGFIWAAWHIPMWFIPGIPEGQIPFWLFTIDKIATAIALTWIYNGTGGSLLVAGLLHLTQNLAININAQLGLMPQDISYFTIVAFDVVLAITLIILTGPENLSSNQDIPKVNAKANAAQPAAAGDLAFGGKK
jgi:membrane protease YdiL (CAAX protease family)